MDCSLVYYSLVLYHQTCERTLRGCHGKFGTRLKRLRSQAGLTAEQVAKKLKFATSTYREWEYGRAIQGEPYIEQ